MEKPSPANSLAGCRRTIYDQLSSRRNRDCGGIGRHLAKVLSLVRKSSRRGKGGTEVGGESLDRAGTARPGVADLVGYHFGFVRRKGSQNFFLFPFGHPDGVEGAPELSRHFIEFF